jgi:hypothetical protein
MFMFSPNDSALPRSSTVMNMMRDVIALLLNYGQTINTALIHYRVGNLLVYIR